MYFFQRYRIGRGGVDIRRALKTEGLIDQLELSLEPFEVWLLDEFLYIGIVRCSAFINDLNGRNIGIQINRNEMREQYLEWHKKEGAKGKVLNSKRFGIKFGSYFPEYDSNGNIQKNKMGRIISIFTKNDTTNVAGHIYAFPSLKETREIVLKRIGKLDIYYWGEGSGDWEPHPDSAHLKAHAKVTSVAPPVDMQKLDQVVENVIPMHKK
jgi:hypothetical protein